MTPKPPAIPLMAAGEAATNAIKHATCSEHDLLLARIASSCASPTAAAASSRSASGSPASPGFSTRLSWDGPRSAPAADRVWLATSAEGTVVQLEKWIHPEDHQEPALTSALEKM